MTLPTEKDDESMALPEGKRCNDCRHIKHCIAYYGILSTNTECDFHPIRFRDSALPEGKQ